MRDTTWGPHLIDEKYGESYSCEIWFDKWFTGRMVPVATGGFEYESYSSSHMVSSCRECGALVMHGSVSTENENLNQHRRWHDSMGSTFESAEPA